MKNPWKTTSVKEIYDNPWIKLTHREVINPSGNEGIYGVVHFKNIAVGIIPLDEEDHTWLVGQYRYTLEQYSWEIPEGGSPVGESILESAKRELKEETGIEAAEWEQFLEIHLSNSVTDEYGVAFVARNLSFGAANPEDTEQLKVKKLPFKEVVGMVMRGEITDALSVSAVLKLAMKLGKWESGKVGKLESRKVGK